jgi:cytochrome b6-f complex iron-sulfur subunit
MACQSIGLGRKKEDFLAFWRIVSRISEERVVSEPFHAKRRSFLWSVLLFMGTVLAMMITWGTARFVMFRTGKKRHRQVSADALAALQPDAPLHVPAAGAWLLKRSTETEPLALDDRCTHLGCAIKWNAHRSLFECPCHGSEFDAGGQVKHGPATRSLPRFSLNKGEDGKLRLLERPPAAPASS